MQIDKKVDDFIESKSLKLSRDIYSGYNIPYSYLVSMLSEFASMCKREEASGFSKYLCVNGWISSNGIVYENSNGTLKTFDELYSEYLKIQPINKK